MRNEALSTNRKRKTTRSPFVQVDESFQIHAGALYASGHACIEVEKLDSFGQMTARGILQMLMPEFPTRPSSWPGAQPGLPAFRLR